MSNVPDRRPTERRVWDDERLPWIVVGVAAAVFVVWHAYLLRNVGLANDEWQWLLKRSTGWAGVTTPYNQQPILGEVLLYRGWAHVIGVAHRWPLTLAFALTHVTIAMLVFTLARRRIGGWAAACVAVTVLWIGRAWETLLFPPSWTFLLPVLAACVAWTALDRRSGPAARLGTVLLLAVAGLSGGLMPAILVALAVELAVERRWRWLWMPAVAVVPFAAWALQEHPTRGLDIGANLSALPEWAVKYLAAAAGATVGLPPAGGAALLVLGLVGAWVFREQLRSRATPRLAGLLTLLALAVVTTGAARAGDTPPTSSRYLYVLPIVLLLIGCELLRGVRLPSGRGRAVVAALTVLVALAGADQLRKGKVFYLRASDGMAARFGAVELLDGDLAADAPILDPAGIAYTPSYLGAFARRDGSEPFDTLAELHGALPESRVSVVALLAALRPTPGPHCRAVATAVGSSC